MAAIETTNLARRFGEVAALSGLTLSVEDGALFGLLGPNGSGKTTTADRPTRANERLFTGVSDPLTGQSLLVAALVVSVAQTAAVGWEARLRSC